MRSEGYGSSASYLAINRSTNDTIIIRIQRRLNICGVFYETAAFGETGAQKALELAYLERVCLLGVS